VRCLLDHRPSRAASETPLEFRITFDLGVGETVQAATLVSGADMPSQVTWESSDPSIATVDAAGVVTGVSPGKVDIVGNLLTWSASRTLRVLSGDEISITFFAGAGLAAAEVGCSVAWRLFGRFSSSSWCRVVYDKTAFQHPL